MPRLNVEITEEQKRGLDRIMDHGMRKILFQLLISDLIALCDKHGAGIVIGALVSRSIGVKEICALKEAKNGDN